MGDCQLVRYKLLYPFLISRGKMLMLYMFFSQQCLCQSENCSMLCGYVTGALDTCQYWTYLFRSIAVMAIFKIAKANLQLQSPSGRILLCDKTRLSIVFFHTFFLFCMISHVKQELLEGWGAFLEPFHWQCHQWLTEIDDVPPNLLKKKKVNVRP
jgi:hypothetical protein